MTSFVIAPRSPGLAPCSSSDWLCASPASRLSIYFEAPCCRVPTAVEESWRRCSCFDESLLSRDLDFDCATGTWPLRDLASWLPLMCDCPEPWSSRSAKTTSSVCTAASVKAGLRIFEDYSVNLMGEVISSTISGFSRLFGRLSCSSLASCSSASSRCDAS